jgi:penicillin G amidase
VSGKTPIKSPEQGRRTQDGSLSDNNWKGFIPFENMPSERNPSRGWVGSANQNSAPPSYPYFLWGADFEYFRSRRFYDLAEKMDSVTTDDMKVIQQDVFYQLAADALPAMLKLLNINELSAPEKLAADQLSAWDFNYSAEKIEPTLFKMWFDSLYEKTWDEFFAKMNVEKTNILTPENWRFAEILQKETNSKWFDIAATPEKETAQILVTQTFKNMVAAAAPKLLTGDLAWYKDKGTEIRHIARIPGFGLKNIKIGGQRGILNAAGKYAGPSWRMIVELTPDGPIAQAVIPGGVSGNPGSPNYESGVDEWTRGDYFKLNFYKKKEDANVGSVQQNFSGN